MARNYYMVRLQDNCFDLAEINGIVGIGWSNYNISVMSVDDITEDIEVKTKKRNDIKRFMGIKKGDIILVPHWNCIWIAEATDGHIYDENSIQYDIANQIKVKYQRSADGSIRLISRNQLSEGLARRFRMRGGTVLNLNEYENEINEIFYNSEYSVSYMAAEHEKQMISQFKDKLRHNICEGNVFLKAGGRGLEELVSELFRIEGFETKILSKRAFSNEGDADVSAEKSFANMKFSLLIQVKHHSGYTGIQGIEQLEVLRRNGEDKGYDRLMLITSGDISDDVRKEAENNNIYTMDGEELVDWISVNISKLSEETKLMLKINILPIIWN